MAISCLSGVGPLCPGFVRNHLLSWLNIQGAGCSHALTSHFPSTDLRNPNQTNPARHLDTSRRFALVNCPDFRFPFLFFQDFPCEKRIPMRPQVVFQSLEMASPTPSIPADCRLATPAFGTALLEVLPLGRAFPTTFGAHGRRKKAAKGCLTRRGSGADSVGVNGQCSKGLRKPGMTGMPHLWKIAHGIFATRWPHGMWS